MAQVTEEVERFRPQVLGGGDVDERVPALGGKQRHQTSEPVLGLEYEGNVQQVGAAHLSECGA